MNSCRTLQEICTPERDAGWDSSQAFYKRFSGPVRALPPEPAGADAWRATTYGHGVLQTNPHGSALDQESPGSIPGGAIIKGRSAVAGGPFDCPSRILALACAARWSSLRPPVAPAPHDAAKMPYRRPRF